jgi:hypothetical protein
MEHFAKLVGQKGISTQPVPDFSLIVDDKQHIHGCIFTVKIDNKRFKLVVPSPFHEPLILDDKIPTIQEILRVKETMLLR